MATFEVKKRTFAASKMPKDSAERAEANKDFMTSEYLPSYKYVLFCYRDDGSVAWNNCFRTKAEAERKMNDDIRATQANTAGS